MQFPTRFILIVILAIAAHSKLALAFLCPKTLGFPDMFPFGVVCYFNDWRKLFKNELHIVPMIQTLMILLYSQGKEMKRAKIISTNDQVSVMVLEDAIAAVTADNTTITSRMRRGDSHGLAITDIRIKTGILEHLAK